MACRPAFPCAYGILIGHPGQDLSRAEALQVGEVGVSALPQVAYLRAQEAALETLLVIRSKYV